MLGGTLLFGVLIWPATAAELSWNDFKHAFIEANGRVIDIHQNHISHSEGPGIAMLLAVHHDDRAAFDNIWRWTRTHLQIRDDHLLAWRWEPGNGITDKNNASDGDLLVAWALLRAAKVWHVQGYLDSCREIAQDIRRTLLRHSPNGLIILPGAEGFEKDGATTINLSYWIFPALDEMDQADPAPEWKALADNGIQLLQMARFGRWALPPDWLIIANGKPLSPGANERFGYDALRIPLYLLWSQRETGPMLQPYRAYWQHFDGAKFLPAWTSLKDDSVDSHDASAGIHQLAQWIVGQPHTPASNHSSTADGYYSTALIMLVDQAHKDRVTFKR